MQVGGGAKSGPSEEGRGWRNRLIGQMVTEIVSEAKAGHFPGLIPVILPLLDGRSSHRNGTTGDPNEKAHPVVNRTLQVARMQNARRKFTIGALELRLGFGAKIDISGVTRIEQDGRRT